MKITVTMKTGDRTADIQPGESLLEGLQRMGIPVPAACGGRGVCGKCAVRLLKGRVTGAEPDETGRVLSCEAVPGTDVIVEVPDFAGTGLTASSKAHAAADGEAGFGAAVDIGTTTVALYCLDLQTGEELASTSLLNPQASLGADVLSRIDAAEHGKTELLAELIRGSVRAVLDGWRETFGFSSYRRVAVCGNTTMLHLFAGVNPVSLGKYPFTPVFTEERKEPGAAYDFPAEEVLLLPSVSAYVGADISAGILATGLTDGGPALLIDIGTNGEMAVWTGGELFSCSTAAGPAFEGANISCGMGGVAGAISAVRLAGGDVAVTTVSGEATGLCGAGLVDCIAVMLAAGALDETGAFVSPEEIALPPVAARMRPEGFLLAPGVSLRQRDVREFQTAKSAIRAGAEVLVKRAGLELSQIERVYIAGGLGFYLNKHSAFTTDLLPAVFAGRIFEAGNAAGLGTKDCLLSAEKRERCRSIAASCKSVELGGDSEFMDLYVEHMLFPDAENA